MVSSSTTVGLLLYILAHFPHRTISVLSFEPPSYEGDNIVNLMASILSATGGRSQYAELHCLDTQRLTNAQNIVLLVIDGLGFEFLQSCSAGDAMRAHLKSSMTSVFPPTTASAVTTYLTGLAPRQHGLTGWFMYFKELDTVTTVLPFTTRMGATPLTELGVTARSLLGHVPVFDAIDQELLLGLAGADCLFRIQPGSYWKGRAQAIRFIIGFLRRHRGRRRANQR